jgi:hypothetical protein
MYFFSVNVFDRHLHYTPFKGNTTKVKKRGDRAILLFSFIKKSVMFLYTLLFARKYLYNFTRLDLHGGRRKIKGYHHEQPNHFRTLQLQQAAVLFLLQ